MNIKFLKCEECNDDTQNNLLEINIGGNYITLCPECALRLIFSIEDFFKEFEMSELITDDDLLGRWY